MKNISSFKTIKIFKILVCSIFIFKIILLIQSFDPQHHTNLNSIQERINHLCPLHSYQMEGPLNISQILKEFNLSSLVEFHNNKTFNLSTFLYNSNFVFNQNLTPVSEHFWQLWNTRNISLLNTSGADFDFTNGSVPVKLGGSWRPLHCKSRFKLAIIVPFRDRLAHLKVLSRFLHMLLQRQLIDYRIFVVEPFNNIIFNKGLKLFILY